MMNVRVLQDDHPYDAWSFSIVLLTPLAFLTLCSAQFASVAQRWSDVAASTRAKHSGRCGPCHRTM